MSVFIKFPGGGGLVHAYRLSPVDLHMHDCVLLIMNLSQNMCLHLQSNV